MQRMKRREPMFQRSKKFAMEQAMEEDDSVHDVYDPIVKVTDTLLLHITVPAGEDAMFAALRYNDQDMVEQELRKGVDINVTQSGEQYKVQSISMGHMIQTKHYRPLHIAALHCSVKLIETLIDKGAHLDGVDDTQRTPIHFAVVANRLSVVRLLVLKGASLDVRSSSGRTPLLEAVINEFHECAQLLVEAGADIDLPDSKGTSPLLHLSFGRNPNMKFIQMLLKRGCNVNTTNLKGATPLMYAATLRQINLMHLLVERGANINQTDCEGKTAMHIFVQLKSARLQPNTLLFLLHNGASLHTPDRSGDSLLNKAIRSMSIYTIKLLLIMDCPREASVIMEQPEVQTLCNQLPDFKEWLLEELYIPRSLMRLCRGEIRKRLSPDRLMRVDTLQLPRQIQDYLLGRNIRPPLR